ncbi:hypothetical protein MRX96_001062 [Rhipicephalus microplus]
MLSSSSGLSASKEHQLFQAVRNEDIPAILRTLSKKEGPQDAQKDSDRRAEDARRHTRQRWHVEPAPGGAAVLGARDATPARPGSHGGP